MIKGRMRKNIKLNYGEENNPWSICTDGSIVFVVTAGESLLQLLSAEQGLLLAFVSLRHFSIVYPTSLRLQRDHLFVGHLNERQDTFCVSKFIKPFVA